MNEYSQAKYWNNLDQEHKTIVKFVAQNLSWLNFNAGDASFVHWGGAIFWDYVYTYEKSKAEQKLFEEGLTKITNTKFETFMKVSSQGLGEENTITAFCYSAAINENFRKTSFNDFMVNFYDYVTKHSQRVHFNLTKFDDVISALRRLTDDVTKDIISENDANEIILMISGETENFDYIDDYYLDGMSEESEILLAYFNSSKFWAKNRENVSLTFEKLGVSYTAVEKIADTGTNRVLTTAIFQVIAEWRNKSLPIVVAEFCKNCAQSNKDTIIYQHPAIKARRRRWENVKGYDM